MRNIAGDVLKLLPYWRMTTDLALHHVAGAKGLVPDQSWQIKSTINTKYIHQMANFFHLSIVLWLPTSQWATN